MLTYLLDPLSNPAQPRYVCRTVVRGYKDTKTIPFTVGSRESRGCGERREEGGEPGDRRETGPDERH